MRFTYEHLTEGRVIRVIDVEYAADQEPEPDADESFATLMRTRFHISSGGWPLARLFGKQRRVLPKFLAKVTKRQALDALLDPRGREATSVSQAALQALKPRILGLIRNSLEADTLRNVEMDWALESDLPYRADITPAGITYEVEVEVIGEAW